MGIKSCLKAVLYVLNSVFLIACGGLVYVGVKALQEYTHYSHLAPQGYMIGLPAGIIFFVASLVFVVAIVGFIATSTENKCVIATYCTFLLITFVLLVAAIGILFAIENLVNQGLEDGIGKGLQSYFLDHNITEEIDYMQQAHSCCGVNHYSDWIGTPWYQNRSSPYLFPYPDSCCPGLNCTNATDVITFISNNTTNCTDIDYDSENGTVECVSDSILKNVYTRGCYPVMESLLMTEFIITSSVCATVMFLSIVGFVLICLVYKRKQSIKYIGLVEEGSIGV